MDRSSCPAPFCPLPHGRGSDDAASLVLAAVGWMQGGTSTTDEPVSLPQQYATFVKDAGDVVLAAWSGKEAGFENVTGQVAWSDERQMGFMKLEGLPPNDPKVKQYQLWIVDPDRDQFPVDGGVFDVLASSGEVIVPIDAKLEVGAPTVFAITSEKPGGVVKSAGP
ncbi:MAG: anti-sigma factor, partial [Planctomycetota bacterium]